MAIKNLIFQRLGKSENPSETVHQRLFIWVILAFIKNVFDNSTALLQIRQVDVWNCSHQME